MENGETSAGRVNDTIQPRFKHYLKSNLIHIRKNLYLNSSDPLFYEKMLRYSDPKSPEAHYMLARKYEKDGSLGKALFHYQEAAGSITSPYALKARQAARNLRGQRQIGQELHVKAPQRNVSGWAKWLLISLLAANLVLLILLWNIDTVRAVVSKATHWPIGKEVVYETVDVPFVIYLPYNEAVQKIEKTLYGKAMEMASNQPGRNIQLFGIMTSDRSLLDRAIPLTSEALKQSAFVQAEYNASIDPSVRIRFINRDVSKQSAVSTPLNQVAVNLVRTALQTYIQEKGSPPPSIESLAGDYPDNYLSIIPGEAVTGDNHVVARFDGKGGWVFHPNAGQVADMFYPNSVDEQQAKQIPYEPVRIVVSKQDYTLKVVSGSFAIASKPVGLGKQDGTPEGDYTIRDRVIKPTGNQPNVYGEAGLGMGQYAIHGTNDLSSIKANKSLGCVRLSNQDIKEIFPLVPKGAPVQIVQSFPPAYENIAVLNADRLMSNKKLNKNETAVKPVFNWLG